MITLKLTDQQFEDLQSATFYAMHFWHKEFEITKDEMTQKVYHKYEDIYKVFNQ